MKLIGITGKSGAGKTTFSEIIAQKENVGVIHIDDLLKEKKLKYLYCYKKLDRIILMKRSFTKRTKALIERDNLTKREIAIYDVAHYKGNYKQEENNNIIKVENNNDINQLNIIADEVYEEILRKSNYVFQKKYKIHNESMRETRNSTIKKDKNNERSKEL